MFYLILIGMLWHSVSITTIPQPFPGHGACERAGQAWEQNEANKRLYRSYLCIPAPSRE